MSVKNVTVSSSFWIKGNVSLNTCDFSIVFFSCTLAFMFSPPEKSLPSLYLSLPLPPSPYLFLPLRISILSFEKTNKSTAGHPNEIKCNSFTALAANKNSYLKTDFKWYSLEF